MSAMAPTPSVRKLPATAAGDSGRPLHKGQQTRATILDAALMLASQMGLEGLSIGALAEVTGMSKSGVFAHFGSREELQISVIREYHERFEQEVFFPGITAVRGLPRLVALFERWLKRVSVELDSGCIYISGAVEFDDRPGPVRDALVAMVQSWHRALARAIEQALQEQQLKSGTDVEQVLFELHGLVLAVHHDARLLHASGAVDRARVGFRSVVERHATPAGLAWLASSAPARERRPVAGGAPIVLAVQGPPPAPATSPRRKTARRSA
jgi:AcrR family transcriptional regulator